MESKIRKLLLSLGVDPSLSGYDYLVDAVAICYEDRTYLRMVTKKLYPYIAKKNNSTMSKVERAMRVAIEKSPEMCPEVYEKLILLPPTDKGKYTNSQFIGACVEQLRMER